MESQHGWAQLEHAGSATRRPPPSTACARNVIATPSHGPSVCATNPHARHSWETPLRSMGFATPEHLSWSTCISALPRTELHVLRDLGVHFLVSIAAFQATQLTTEWSHALGTTLNFRSEGFVATAGSTIPAHDHIPTPTQRAMQNFKPGSHNSKQQPHTTNS